MMDRPTGGQQTRVTRDLPGTRSMAAQYAGKPSRPPRYVRRGLVINNPNVRNAHVNNVITRTLAMGDAATAIQLAYTPKPLLLLVDHSGRGQKSLGRIQQLTNRKRFHRRPGVSR